MLIIYIYNMNIYIITENEYKKKVVEKVFMKRYSNIIQNIIRLSSKSILSNQFFEEEIEFQAYSRIQDFLQNSRNIKKPDDWVIGIQTGLMKCDDRYEEVSFILIHYMGKTYSIDSKRIKIDPMYNQRIHESQSDRNKIFNIYDQMGFENRRMEILEETLMELLDRIFNIRR